MEGGETMDGPNDWSGGGGPLYLEKVRPRNSGPPFTEVQKIVTLPKD